MKTIKFKKILSFFTVLVLSLSVFCFAGCNKPVEDEKTSFDLNPNNFTFNNTISDGIVLRNLNAILVEDDEGSYLEETIIATVNSGTNAVTTLNWTVNWQDTNVTKDVSEFLTLTKVSSNGHEIKVRCYKNFENYGPIILVAKSVTDSKLSATCVCNYVGYPTSFKFYNHYSPDYDFSLKNPQEMAVLGSSTFFLFDFELSHGLEVGSQFGKNYDIKFELVESGDYNEWSYVDLYCELYGSNGLFGEGSLDGVLTTELVSKQLKFKEYYDVLNPTVFKDLSKYFTYEIDYENQNLRLQHVNRVDNLFNGADGLESYSGGTNPSSGCKAVLKGYRFVVKMIVTETASNLRSEIYFMIVN